MKKLIKCSSHLGYKGMAKIARQKTPQLAPHQDALPSSIVVFGKTMTFAGHGKFPYPCIAKDLYPGAAIYKFAGAGWNTWTHEYAIDFLNRDKSKDHHNSLLLHGSLTSASLYKVVDNEINRRYFPELVGKYVLNPIPYCLVKTV